MNIALAQLNYHIGNFEGNTSKILSCIEKARNEGVDLLIFAELAVSGYPPRDFLEFDDFDQKCLQSVEQIAKACTGIAVILGGPSPNPHSRGKPLFNSAFFLAGGKVQDRVDKTLLPTYDIFDEYRYFEPNREFKVIEFKGKRLALTICEDLWMEGVHPLYTLNPMEELATYRPDLIINIAASPFHYTQAETRRNVLKANTEQYHIPIIYVNHVGAQTELLFDGGSMVMNSYGKVVLALRYFEEDYGMVRWDEDQRDLYSDRAVIETNPSTISQIHDALVMGIRDYFSKLGFSRAVLGLSGGIDSAVVLVLAARALGRENVTGVLMPSDFSTSHSVTDAVLLSENLGTGHLMIPISDSYEAINESLKPVFGDLPFNITEENIQARLRAVILMALSNKFGSLLLNTSNKSEAAVGYGTLYGDMCGAISVLGDLYKTQVFELAAYINREKEVIPQNIITKPPSAELRPGQKDSDSLPPYEILDPILYQYIELRKGPREIIDLGFDELLVRRILKLVNTSEHKRYQTPPILRISSKAFGMGRRMPLVGKYLS